MERSVNQQKCKSVFLSNGPRYSESIHLLFFWSSKALPACPSDENSIEVRMHMEHWWNEKLWQCEFVWKVFLSNCHLWDIRSMNFLQGVRNRCCVIRWALCYAFKKYEVRFPSEHRPSSVSGVWHSCLTVQYSDGCRSVARRAKDLSLLRNVRTGCGAHRASYSVRPELKTAGAWCWLPASTTRVNTWPDFSVLPYAFTARC
jgi:hypothetical protein